MWHTFCCPLGLCSKYDDSSLPTFRGNLSVPFSRAKQSKKRQFGTTTLSCVKSHSSPDVSYIAAENWSQPFWVVCKHPFVCVCVCVCTCVCTCVCQIFPTKQKLQISLIFIFAVKICGFRISWKTNNMTWRWLYKEQIFRRGDVCDLL